MANLLTAAAEWKVYNDGQYDPSLKVLSVHQGINGDRDSASIRKDWALEGKLPELGDRLYNISTSITAAHEIEITRTIDGVEKPMFWGRVAQYRLGARGDTEYLVPPCRQERYHFGTPISRVAYAVPTQNNGSEKITFSHEDNGVLWVDLPLIFNPLVDGQIFGNRHPEKTLLSGASECYLFVHPWSTQTASAREFYGNIPPGVDALRSADIAYAQAWGRSAPRSTIAKELQASEDTRKATELQAEQWSLVEVVRYLCTTLNGHELYFKNPTKAELEEAIVETSDQVLDVRFRTGAYLPDCLTALLEPRGYGWFVEYGEQRGERKIRVFDARNGRNPQNPVWLKMQEPGSLLDPELTNTSEFDVTQDFTSLANRVRVTGGFVAVQNTFELVRGWPAGLDDSPFDEIVGGQSADPERNVWRKFVLNEAGDYNNMDGRDYSTFDFSDTFDAGKLRLTAGATYSYLGDYPIRWIPRRRRFLQALVCKEDGKPPRGPDGVWVEIKSAEHANWTPIVDVNQGLQVSVAPDECAIYIEHNPWVVQQGDDFRVRVTATVESDTRLESVVRQQQPADRPGGRLDINDPADSIPRKSAVSDDITLDLDMSDRLALRLINEDSATIAECPYSYTRDDRQRAVSLAVRALSSSDVARVRGTAVLPGHNVDDYTLGVPVKGVDGRRVYFNCLSHEVEEDTRLPLITSREFDVVGQTTRLSLDMFRDHVSPADAKRLTPKLK